MPPSFQATELVKISPHVSQCPGYRTGYMFTICLSVSRLQNYIVIFTIYMSLSLQAAELYGYLHHIYVSQFPGCGTIWLSAPYICLSVSRLRNYIVIFTIYMSLSLQAAELYSYLHHIYVSQFRAAELVKCSR